MTMTTAAPIRYTPADVERLSDRDGKLYELVNGALVEKRGVAAAAELALAEKHVSTRSNAVAVKIAVALSGRYPDTEARVFIEQPTYCFPDGRMRRPDVALVWSRRLPAELTHDELGVAPDLVAEVVSPNNTFFEQLDRVEEYLRAGVPIVWVVDPTHRTVHVYRNDGTYDLLRSGELLADEPLLPGLSFPVADIFPAVAPVSAPAPQS